MLPERPTREQLKEHFSADQFATRATGCEAVEGWKGHGVAELELSDIHLNALGRVMGGAIFTLADFALAIACNIAQGPTVNVATTIEYLSATKGSRLTATADCVKEGRRVAFYDVVVMDDLGVEIAKMSVTAYRPTQSA